jgi:hypothetical protein
VEIEKNKMIIGNISVVIYGNQLNKVYLFVHGQGGNKEEAESFAKIK